ncbi:MAG: hypothetical protein LC637_09465, partial [Xanthomonadaceae bacterium]|nr:hypothetical protein [Xanthomonadaceae bacterium]
MVETLRFSTLHVSSKDLKVLKSLLSLSSGKSEQQWSIVDDEDSDGVLIDVDDPDGAAIWPELSRGKRPAVAVSRQREFPARLLLHKPIRAQQLIRLMAELALAADNPVDPEQWSILSFGDDGAQLPLAEHLRRHNWDQPVLIGGDDLAELIIDPGAGVWYSGASDRELARLLRRKFSRDDPRRLSSTEFVRHTNGLEQQSLANLKWRSGLALSSGSL